MTEVELSYLREHAKRLERENRELRDRLTEASITISGLKRSQIGESTMSFDPTFSGCLAARTSWVADHNHTV